MTGPADARVEPTGWLDWDADQDDLTHYMQATARMRERAEQAEAELERVRQREVALRELVKALEGLVAAYRLGSGSRGARAADQCRRARAALERAEGQN